VFHFSPDDFAFHIAPFTLLFDGKKCRVLRKYQFNIIWSYRSCWGCRRRFSRTNFTNRPTPAFLYNKAWFTRFFPARWTFRRRIYGTRRWWRICWSRSPGRWRLSWRRSPGRWRRSPLRGCCCCLRCNLENKIFKLTSRDLSSTYDDGDIGDTKLLAS
jgi:hypothetical protein